MNQRTKGIIAILISAAGFALMNLFIPLSGALPTMQKAFFRNIVAFAIALVILLRQRRNAASPAIPQNRGRAYLLLTLRATFGTIGIFCNYYALDHLLISDASVLNKLAPFATLIFSAVFLGERIKKEHLSMLVLAFIGVLFVTKPTLNNPQLAPYLIGTIGGIAAGAAYTCVRQLNRSRVQPAFIVMFFSGFSCLASIPQLILDFHPMTWMSLLMLIGAGIAAAIGQFGVTFAYKFAPAKEISIYDYATIIFTGTLGFTFLSQHPDLLSLLGYAIIFAAALLNFIYNRRQDAEMKQV